MIFGSAECNDVMARYEKAWINLFIREGQLRRLRPLAGHASHMQGLLLSDTRSWPGYTSDSNSPFMIPLTDAQKTQRREDEQKWPWLCYVMCYALELSTGDPLGLANPASWILGELSLVDTTFFPFQRRFCTLLEEKVDAMIVETLFGRYIPPPAGPPPPPDRMMSIRTSNESMGSSSSSTGTDAHKQLWRTMLNNPASIDLDHVTLGNPRFVMVDHDGAKDVPPATVGRGPDGHAVLMQDGDSHNRGSDRTEHIHAPPEFTVKGDMKLFGIIPATLSTVQHSAALGVSQRVDLTGDLSLGNLIPELLHTPLDTISLKNTYLTYSSTFQRCSPPGMRFHTEIIPTGELMQPVYDVLHEVFGQKNPAWTFAGFIGQEPAWEKPFAPMGFSLRAGLRKLDIDLWDVINVTDLGLSLTFSRRIPIYPGDPSSGYSLSTSFSGSAGVKIPGSVVPLRVSWYLKKFAKYYLLSLNMQDDEWTDAFAIPNLKVGIRLQW